jgi:hypothetical protein
MGVVYIFTIFTILFSCCRLTISHNTGFSDGGKYYHEHSHTFDKPPSEYFHVVNAEIVDSGSLDHPWRQAYQRKRRLDSISETDVINSDHTNFEQSIFPSHHANPPYGETVTLNIHVKCRNGVTKINLNKLKLTHHKDLIHKNAVIEFTGQDGIQKNIPLPNTVYYHYNNEQKLWVHLSVIDHNNFHAVIHSHGKAYVIEPHSHHNVPGKPRTFHDQSTIGRNHHRRLTQFYKRHQSIYGEKPNLIAFEKNNIVFPSFDIMSENRKIIHVNRKGEPINLDHVTTGDTNDDDNNDEIQNIEVLQGNAKRRNLVNGMSFKPVPGNYKGPYTRVNSDCPSTLHMMHVAYGADAGFFKMISGYESGDTVVHLQKLSALLSSICATSNLVLSQQLNLVSRIRRIVAFSDSNVGPQGSTLDWNQEPLDATVSGGNRGTKGCPISRNRPDTSSCCTLANGKSDYSNYLTRAELWWSDRDQDKNNNGKPSGIFHVFTNCFPPSGTVGLAYVGTVCSRSLNNVGWTNAGRDNAGATWEVYAHELGHNLGASHAKSGFMSYRSHPEFKLSDAKK